MSNYQSAFYLEVGCRRHDTAFHDGLPGFNPAALLYPRDNGRIEDLDPFCYLDKQLLKTAHNYLLSVGACYNLLCKRSSKDAKPHSDTVAL